MRVTGPCLFAALPASATAGPIFLLSLSAIHAYSQLPEPIPFDGNAALLLLFSFLVMLVPTIMVGFVLSFLPNALCTHILTLAGESSETAREPVLWMGIGGLLGLGIAILFGAFEASIAVTLALMTTSIACAGICRSRTCWEDDRPAQA